MEGQSQFILIILMLLLLSCKETSEKKILQNDYNEKYNKQLLTEYNPVFISRDCKLSTKIKVFVPKPNPHHFGNSPYRKVDSHLLKYYIDSLEIDNILFDDNFFVQEDSMKISSGYKIVELEMPSFSDTLNESGTITLKLFTNEKLISSYKTQYNYIQDMEPQKTVKRSTVKVMQYAGALKLNNYNNDLKIKESGYYTDDIKISHTIIKMQDHYLSTYVAEGSEVIFSKDNKTNWIKIMTVPEFPKLTSKIPLEFELKEKEYKGQTVGSYVIEPESLGKNIIFSYYNEVIGNAITFQFNQCKLDILESKKVSMPTHLRFNTMENSN